MTEDQLEEFFADQTVHHLRALARETDALAIAYPKEMQISNFLAWLLSPGEGHGLGDLPLRSLLRAAWQNAEPRVRDGMFSISPSRLGLISLGAALCIREFGVETGRCDLAIVDPVSKVIAILENKYGAAQGPDQLSRYKSAVTKRMKNSTEWTQLYIFMDSDSNSVPNGKGWIKLDYQWAVDLIDQQLALGHVSSESLQVLRTYRPYLDDVFEQPFVALEDADEKVLHIAEKHSAVLKKMERFRQWTWQDTVNEMTSTAPSPLLVEYQQRYRLWDYVIDASAWITFTKPVALKISDIDFDAKVKSLYICRKAWLNLWAPSAERGHWPGWIKIYHSRAGENMFTVEAVIYMQMLSDDVRSEVLARARKIRSRHMLRAVQNDVDRIVLTKVKDGLERTAALREILELSKIVDEALGT
nr:PD-(D/E)XK nuclease family protein [uncultured Comamonas sp.]